ncbi:MAG: Hsp20/alpha crystallin family protein [Catenulispora sp.]
MTTPPARRRSAPERPGSGWGLPWEPLGDLDDLFGRLGRWTGWLPGAGAQGARWMPVAEEDETADSYRVRAELPGIPRDRVTVEVESGQLCIRGDLDEKTEQDSYLTHRAGSFLYRTSLPADADQDQVQADLTDGVLTVTVPRSGRAGRRTVPIGGTTEHETIAGETTGMTGPAETTAQS